MTTDAIDRLAEMEALEFRAVDVLARGGIRADIRASIVKGLGQLRAAKHRLLANDPSILRKASALNPDSTLGHDTSPVFFRAPTQLCNMTIHTVSGMIVVPPSGVIQTRRDHAELHADLAGRGFKRMRNLDVGKASAADIVNQFRASRLTRLTGLPFAGVRS